jgi:hypothetical protein
MSKVTRVILWLVILVIGLGVFYDWYLSRYSMEVIDGFEMNDTTHPDRVLIASQGSDFKNAVVAEVTAHFTGKPVYMKVVDVTELGKEQSAEWVAILVLHTWEKWKPQPDAAAFLSNVVDRDRVMVVSTSGSGDEQIVDVDAITGASEMETVPEVASQCIKHIEKWL